MNYKKPVFISTAVVVLGLGVAYGLSSMGNVNKGHTLSAGAVLQKLSSDQLESESYGLVLGTVSDVSVNKESSFIRPGDNDIITSATVQVEKYLLNPHAISSKSITVKTVGGTVGGETMTAEGSPTFRQGERVVIFLNRKDDEAYTVYGWALGKFAVNSDGTLGSAEEKAYLPVVFGKDLVTLKELEDETASRASVK